MRALLLVTLLFLLPSTAHAQLCSDSEACGPPSVQLVASEYSTMNASITLTIYASDGKGLALGTWKLWNNGTEVTTWLTGKMSIGLMDQTATATGSFGLSVGTNTIVTRICDTGTGSTCDTDTIAVVRTTPPTPPAKAAPVATLAQRNDARSLDGCAMCASGTASYSTPAFYFSGQAITATLYYSTELAKPTGFVELDVTIPASTTPQWTSVQLKDSPTGMLRTLSNGTTEAFRPGSLGPTRLAAALTADNLSSGLYPTEAIVKAWWSDGTQYLDTVSVRMLIQNERTSAYGRGWVVAGDSRVRLVDVSGVKGVLISGGAGGLAFYKLNGCGGLPCTYASPVGDYASLVRKVLPSTTDTVWVLTERDGARTEWGSTGLLLRSVSALGDSSTVERVGLSDPRVKKLKYFTKIGSTDISRSITFAYNSTTGLLSTITLPDSRVSTFTYTSDSLLQRITDSDGRRAFGASYTSDRITLLSGRDTASTVFAYDAFGQLSSVQGAAVKVEGGATAREVTTVTSLRHLLLDSLGTSSSALGKAAIPSANALLTSRDSRGTTQKVWGHVSGAATRTTVSPAVGSAQTSEVTFDTLYRVIVSSGTGRAGTEYSWSGPLLTETRDVLSGSSVRYHYSTSDRLDSVRVNDKVQLRNYYTSTSILPDSTRSDTANITRFTYDARGRVLTTRDANNATVTMTYESTHGNPATMTRTASDVATITSRTTYDAAGRADTIVDPLGRVFRSQYDALNRDTLQTGAAGETIGRTYNDSTGVYTLRDPINGLYKSVVNARGWVVRQEDPFGTTSDSVQYDTLGRATRTWNRRGDQVRLAYDSLGRMTSRIATSATGGADTTLFSYDPLKRWTAVRNAESTDSLFVDAAGRPTHTRIVRAGKLFQIAYRYTQGDLMDRRTIIRDSSSIATWTAITEFGYDSTRQAYQVRTSAGR